MELPPSRTPLLSYAFQPAVMVMATTVAAMAVRFDLPRPVVLPAVLVSTIALCLLVEWRHPLDGRWSMTARSLAGRDLPYLATGLAVERACEALVAVVTVRLVSRQGFGPVGALPIGLQVVLAVLGFDLAWYWYHRVAHRRARLWRVHGAHHAPAQMYTLAHGVFHPLDQFVVRFVLALGVFRLGGFSRDATFVALVLIGAVGIVSHVNADVRLWAGNHLFVGPETHRYHHSATHEGNYGAMTTLWDQVFHTFVFEPQPPAALGLADPSSYPAPEGFWRVMAWPFRPTGAQSTGRLRAHFHH